MKEIENRKSGKSESEKTGRKEFLTKVWRILGFLALAELTVFFLSMLRPGRKDGKNSPAVLKIIGNVDDFKLNSVTTDRINKILLVRTEDGGFLALSLICSHLGCSVLWDDFKVQFICPCHSSAFDKFGNVMNSPAPRPLDYFPVTIEAGKVSVDLSRKLKRKKFETKQLTYAT
jgi:cytochrome b6-f complex iron-sulfur subunit